MMPRAVRAETAMTRRLRNYTRWVVRHPRLVMAATLIITVVLCLRLGQLRVNYDPDDALPNHHPLIRSNNEIHETFGADLTALALRVDDGDIYRPSVLAKISRMTQAIREIPGVVPSNVLSLTSPNVKDIEGTPEGMNVAPLLPRVPQTQAEAEALKRRVARNRPVQDLLVSADGTMANITSDYESMKKVGGASSLIRRLKAIAEREQDAHTTFHLAGINVLLHWMDVYSERMKYLFPLAVLLVGLLHWHAFRTLQGLIVPLLTAVLSVVWALGILGWFRVNLDPYNLMTPILVLAVAAGHSVQILKRYYEEYRRLHDNQAAIIEATSQVGVAMLAAGIVAAVAMASLMTFDMASIRNFGLFSSLGILSALILEMNFIPALRAWMKPPAPETGERPDPFFDRVLNRCRSWILQGHGPRILLLAGVLLGAASFGAGRVLVDNSFASYFPKHSRVMQDMRAINQQLAGTYTFAVMVAGKQEDTLKDPEVLRAMESLQAYMLTLPGAGKTLSLVDFIKRMNQAMHDDDPRYDAIPATREEIAQYLLLYSLSGEASDLDRLVDFSYRRGVILLYAKASGYQIARDMMRRVDRFVAERIRRPDLTFSYGGGLIGEFAGSEAVIHGKIWNIIQVSVIIFLVASLVFASVTAGLLVLLPLALTVWVNFAFMGFAGIWLNMATASISAVALGMGADYGIYFLFRFREQLRRGDAWDEAFATAILTSGKAILYVATAITLGYASIVLSGFSIHIYVGIMMSLTMVLSSLSTLTLLPALLFQLRPAFLRRYLITPDALTEKAAS